MPLRDYELVQEAKRTGKLLISVNWLLTPLECNPAVCGGHCCKNHRGTPTTAHYHPNELHKLPKEVLQFIEEDSSTVKLDEKGDCALIPYCQQNSSIIPTECRLFPLGFSKWNRLIIKKPAWTGRCPFYRVGRPVYISMKQCLIDVFGEELYNKIVQEVENHSPRF